MGKASSLPINHYGIYPRDYSRNYPVAYHRSYPDGKCRQPANRALVGRRFVINGRPYVFEACLGDGGFGAVYRSKMPNGTPVAIKVIMLNNMPRPVMEGRVQSFLTEVAQLNRLRKETNHVIVIHNFGFDPRAGHAYIIMELGQENLTTLVLRLQQMTQTPGPAIDIDMIKEFWRQTVSIVKTLQKNRIVHMDLKPDNLILFGATLKIGDLGIAKKDDALHDARLGTFGFSAPEVMEDIQGVRRHYSPKADIWSLGAILYFMVYGTAPTYHPILAANPPPRLPPYPDRALLDMLRRTLVRDPRRRANIRQVINHPFTRK
ncbi:hypothetical protein I4U23_010622 [Adineta vaga]|nr:hypothetical protein I4U23_010622 [Adineta vaga]